MVRGLTSGAFNGALAAFAAGATAFAVFVMPADLFAGLAAPLAKLGDGAQFGAAAVSGAIAFLAVWLILRVLDARPVPILDGRPEEGADRLVPRRWRADSHRNAPTPRLLLAGKDLGEPIETVQRIELGEPGPDQDTSRAEEPQPPPLKRILMRTSGNPTEADAIELQPAAPEHGEQIEAPIDGPSESPAKSDQLVVADEREDASGPRSLLDRLALPQDEPVGVARLLRRLDDGFGACEWPLPASEGGGEPEPVDEDRLRGVLDNLQRMAARNPG